LIIHHIKRSQIDDLDAIFAYLTPTGWAIPDWLMLLRYYSED
jgi:hypothetical protein